MNVALVHDHLAQDGGSEKVLKIFQELYPSAPTFVLVHDRKRANPIFLDKDIRTSFIQQIPFGIKKYQWFLPLMPSAVEQYPIGEYDLILSSSSMFAKGILAPPGAVHICYCHTPTRFLWSDAREYVKELKYPLVIKKLLPFLLSRLRVWDRLSADRADYFIANSRTVAKRIERYYGKESYVINPPVETAKFSISNQIGNYFLAGGRLVYYKRFDLIVKAFNMTGIPLKIFGEGPELPSLKKQARPNIAFLGKVSDSKKAELYQRALAFIHPQEEDFGITAVESMSSGRPVIAYAKGGALETLVEGVTGEFFEEQCWEEIADHAVRFNSSRYNPSQIKQHAEKFSVERFKAEILAFIQSKI
ncbi:MAG: glycosyltransferase [Parcubacteria group bacterium]|nr:glycosyltransferase [Parcubacteria group bacterium]